MRSAANHQIHLLVFASLSLFCIGCSSTAYRKNADRDVYQIIADVEESIFGKTSDFTINTEYADRKPKDVAVEEIFENRNREERVTLSIDEAIQLAVNNNRQYQGEKEQLYLTALSLTGERHEFRPQFFARSAATRVHASDGEKSESVNSDAGIGQLLATGTDISVSIANDILEFLTGDPRKSATSTLSFNVFQPLLRGAGWKIAAENLKQAERNVIYAVRDFAHFQNEFALDIVIEYFRLLQQKDTIYNEYNNYQSRIESTRYLRARSVDREKALDVNQAEQAELSSRNRYINSIVRYRNSLDSFKIRLGLPQTVDLRLQDAEMESLEEIGLILSGLDVDTSFRYATEHRLPLLNAIDQFEDSKRKTVVAANRLKPSLGLFASASVDSEEPTNYDRFDFDEARRSIGVQLELPLSRRNERNSYRASLISFESELRSLSLTLDELRSDIERNIRELERLHQNYQIQTNAVALAEKQVSGAQLSIESGNAIFRDLEEAQDDLIAAQNAQTAALVDYLESRLNLLLDIGILITDTNRFWLTDASALSLPERLSANAVSTTLSEDGSILTPDEIFSQ